eukprot:CAMPEP_0114577058 /NCGR_PEP_ID=MMETSP0125-20121206/1760_1 /TAXON_ID=485358 ORGANISM="Aristerostoma sp., Strain ATCC 50986" /NCGR_SAMPLE_ID=MMETSP0125 /ASSEMBLY_ACC=CAM_ASM_000245 /LENGTH=135 /DNA_ID=CAMNT_0001766073 /DNA_START=159 /DNA_END=566 /DNA_ORIENTATION=-
MKQAVFADIPYNKGGLYTAKRTILACICWGESIDYKSGKVAFSALCPVREYPLDKGYLSTKAARRWGEKEKAVPRPKTSGYSRIKDKLYDANPVSDQQKKKEYEDIKTTDLLQKENFGLENDIILMEKTLRQLRD